jgi:hypothetical protein
LAKYIFRIVAFATFVSPPETDVQKGFVMGLAKIFRGGARRAARKKKVDNSPNDADTAQFGKREARPRVETRPVEKPAPGGRDAYRVPRTVSPPISE